MKVMLKPDVVGANEGLSRSTEYEVIGIEADWYRILNDEGLPFLYSPDLFVIVDAAEPADWVRSRGDDGELYAYPPQLNGVGFFEDYHDGNTDAIGVFRSCLMKRGIESPAAFRGHESD